jgi:hypothetical protein
MSPRLTMKQKLEHQADYIKQLKKIKEEYDSLKEFIFKHMCSMIPENKEYLNEIFDNLRYGDFIMCATNRYSYLTKGYSYQIMSKNNGTVEILNDMKVTQKISRNGFVRLKTFTYNKYN